MDFFDLIGKRDLHLKKLGDEIMKITFVRHMQTVSNAKGILQGSSDTELSEFGLEQCKIFVENVDFSDIDVIYSSTLTRAKFLAEMISDKYNKKLINDDRLKEIWLGEWEGLTWKEVTVLYKDFLQEWYKDNVNIKAPGGESYKELQERVMTVIKEITNEDWKHVLIVTHGAVIRTILCTIMGMDLQNRNKFMIENGSISQIELSKYKSKLLALNCKTIETKEM